MSEEVQGWANESLETWEPENPPFRKPVVDRGRLPQMPPELILGLFRRGGILLLQGGSKMGKSFNLICLAVALATGGSWLGFSCRKSRVLYVNLEIMEDSFTHRVFNVVESMDADRSRVMDNMDIWDARGESLTIDDVCARFEGWDIVGKYDAIIIDPLYKVQPGSENDAEQINRFFNAVDTIARGNDTSVIMCHHHSKGGQSKKSAIDRSSGSGVFGRAADVIIDLTSFPAGSIDFEAQRAAHSLEGAIPLWVTFICRDFRSPESFGAWFKHPLYERDATGLLNSEAFRQARNAVHYSKAQEEIDSAIEELMEGRSSITRKEVEAATGKDRRTIDKYIQSSFEFEKETVNNNTTLIKRKGEG